jgi:hypothetical protein
MGSICVGATFAVQVTKAKEKGIINIQNSINAVKTVPRAGRPR